MKRKKKNHVRLPRSLRRLFPKLKYAVDSNKPIEVTVTQRDCDAGKRMKASECAMAVAAKRQYHANGVVIGVSVSWLVKGDTAVRFLTPPSVAREVVSFDRHSDFAPGRYKLSKVPPSRRMGLPRRKQNASGSRDKSRIVHARSVRVRELDN